MSNDGTTPAPFDYPLVFFTTRDLVATDRFYRDLLGLALVRDQGDCRIYRVGARGYIGFCQRPDAAIQPSGVILTLVTDDVDGWHARLSAAGVPVEVAPRHNPTYHIYQCFLRDPNGYLVEIQRFDEPLPR
jgi:catechol 2,3-dioxygenase-like lactoylglutathione lyase family enzyme